MEICIIDPTASNFRISGEPGFDYTTTRTPFDEFVLDLASLPSGGDFLKLFENEAIDDRIKSEINKADVEDRNVSAADDTSLNTSGTNASTISGYESDSEEKFLTSEYKRRVRRFRPRDRPENHISDANRQLKGSKRKQLADENLELKHKRIKASSSSAHDNFSKRRQWSSSDSDCSSSSSDLSSSSDFSSDSSSDSCSSYSWSSSDTSCSDSDTELREDSFNPFQYLNPSCKIIPCPLSCPCNAGPSEEPEPIERRMRTPVPLYKKVLQRRLLGVANRTLSRCCKKQCYLRWLRTKSTKP